MRSKTLYILTILLLLGLLNSCKHESLGSSKVEFETAIRKATTGKLTLHQFIMTPTVKSILVEAKGKLLYQRLLAYSKYSTSSIAFKNSVYIATGWLTLDRGCQLIYDANNKNNPLQISFLDKHAKTDEQGNFICAGLWEKHHIHENDTLSKRYLMLSLLNTEQGGKDTLQLILFNQDLLLCLKGQNDMHKIDQVQLKGLSKNDDFVMNIKIDRVKTIWGYPTSTELYRVYLSDQKTGVLPSCQNDSAKIIINSGNLSFFISSQFAKYEGAVHKLINKQNFFDMSNKDSIYGVFTPKDLAVCYKMSKIDDLNRYMKMRGFESYTGDSYYGWSSKDGHQSVCVDLEKSKSFPQKCELSLHDYSGELFKKRMQFAGYRVVKEKDSECWMHTGNTDLPKTVHYWHAGARGVPCFEFTYK